MKLSQKALTTFKKIYLDKFGIAIDDVEANKLGSELLEFFRLIYRPIKTKDYERIKNMIQK